MIANTQSKKATIAGVGIGIWLVAVVLLRFVPNTTFFDENFHFHRYCPISYDKEHKLVNSLIRSGNGKFLNGSEIGLNGLRSNGIDQLSGQLNPQLNNTYVIYVKVRYNKHIGQNQPTKYQLAYCSLAARWGQRCSDVDSSNYICTSPGPMFIVEKGQATDVIWVNDISVADSHLLSNNSYHQNINDSSYKTEIKTRALVESSCTYPSITESMNNNSFKKQLNWDGVPISTHINGLQVRPTFDGNPLSWFLNDGTKGIGYMSIGLNDIYYNGSIFSQKINTNGTKIGLEEGSVNIKYNRYPNDQAPGNLWYHDHAIKSNNFNIRNGLSGIYIIEDKAIQSKLNQISDLEILIIGENFLPLEPSDLVSKTSHHQELKTSPTYTFRSIYSKPFYRNTLYRFKVLNSNFLTANSFYFSYTLTNNQIKAIQIKLPVIIIGTDSALFQTFVPNVSDWDLGPAERIQLFLDLSKIPDGVNTFSLNAYAPNGDVLVSKTRNFMLKFGSDPDSNLNSSLIPEILPEISQFIDLRKISPIKMRFRTLDQFSFPQKSNLNYYINGHADLAAGEAENPQIGTTEDWFFLNFQPSQHPINVPLVSFQIIQKFSLKQYRKNCSFYSINFYRNVIYNNLTNTQLQNIMSNNDAMCDFIENKVRKMSHMPELKVAHPQTKQHDILFDPLDQAYQRKAFKSSGEYLFTQINDTNKLIYSPKSGFEQNCDSKYANYPYICREIKVPDWQKKWKDVAWAPVQGVVRIRIRWASTDYPLNDTICQKFNNTKTTKIQFICKENDNLSYFKIHEINLAEYPGYVYNCNIPFHEDSGMMRPFMMQFSDRFKRSQPKYKNWKNWTDVINNQKNINCNNLI